MHTLQKPKNQAANGEDEKMNEDTLLENDQHEWIWWQLRPPRARKEEDKPEKVRREYTMWANYTCLYHDGETQS